jgi:hypothetical protein
MNASTAQRRSEAYEMLEVTPAQVAAEPAVSHLLRKLGSRATVLQYLRGSADEDARRFLTVYDRYTKGQQNILPLEAFCVAAKITTKRFFEVISGAVFEQAGDESALLAAAKHPNVVAATIKNALHPLGKDDRKMLHQHQGFLPMPKNTTVNVFGNQRIDARNQTQVNVSVLPALEEGVKRLSDRFNDRITGMKSLPAPVEIVEEDEDE